MIEKVELKNILSHSSTLLPLGEGTTIFVGKNGAGKSSVIDAITYALYGEHTRGDNANLVRDGANSAAVTLNFSSGQGHYRVERKLNNKGQLESSLLSEIQGGSTIQLAAGERKQFGESLSASVAKILGLDYNQMIIAGVIQQGELDSIMDLKSKDLKNLINSAIGMERLELAYESMHDLIDGYRDVVRNKYGYDDQDIPKITVRVAELKRESEESTTNAEVAQRELGALKGQEEDVEKEVKALEPFKLKASKMRTEIEVLIDYVENRRSELLETRNELEEVAGKAQSYFAVLREEGKIEDELTKATSDQERVEATLSDVGPAIAVLESKQEKPVEFTRIIKRCTEALSLIKEEVATKKALKEAELGDERYGEDLASLQGEIAKLEANQATAEKLEFKDNTCPVCGSRVDSIRELYDAEAIRHHLEERREQLLRVRGDGRKLGRELEKLRKMATAIDSAAKQLADFGIATRADLDRLTLEKEELASKLEDLPGLREKEAEAKKRKTTLEKKIAELARKQKEIQVAGAYLRDHKISSDADLQEITKKREGLDRLLQGLPRDLKPLRRTSKVDSLAPLLVDEHSAKLLTTIRELDAELSQFDELKLEKLTREEKRLRGLVLAKSIQVAGLEDERKRLTEDLEKLKESLSALEEVRPYLLLLENIRSRVYYRDGAVSKSIRTWTLSQLGKKASEYARLFEIGVSNITIKESNRDVSIECYGARGRIKTASMSGGEKVAIALALRFALSYVMGGYRLDFIILDEPTVHLDAERKGKLVDIISRLGGQASPMKQIIIITHDSEIFENAEVEAVWRFESTSEGTRITNGIAS